MSKNASLNALAESMRPTPSKAEPALTLAKEPASGSGEVRRLSLYLPPDLYKQLRWLSAESEQSMNEIVIGMLQRSLNNVKAV
jgi:hypothetical protein